jgi:hypothetical protein
LSAQYNEDTFVIKYFPLALTVTLLASLFSCSVFAETKAPEKAKTPVKTEKATTPKPEEKPKSKPEVKETTKETPKEEPKPVEPVLQCHTLDPMQGDLKIALTAPITRLVSVQGQIQELSVDGYQQRLFDYRGISGELSINDYRAKEFIMYPLYALVADTPGRNFFLINPGETINSTERVTFKLNVRGRRLKYQENRQNLFTGSLKVCVM